MKEDMEQNFESTRDAFRAEMALYMEEFDGNAAAMLFIMLNIVKLYYVY
jgi:hypothetical protein